MSTDIFARLSKRATAELKASAAQRKEQVVALRAIAERAGDPSNAHVADAIRLIESVDKAELEKAAAAAEQVIPVLEPLATRQEIDAARISSAVQCGNDTWLPLMRKTSAAPLPHALLRGALFRIGNERVALDDEWIETRSDVTILMSGKSLLQRDKSLLAACLLAYRDRPLARVGDPDDWVEFGESELLRLRGITPSAEMRRQQREDLRALAKASVTVKTRRVEASLAPLIMYKMGAMDDAPLPDDSGKTVDAVEPTPADKSKNSRIKLRIRVTAEIASLFGWGHWSLLEMAGLGQRGLPGWLADFFGTQSTGVIDAVTGRVYRPTFRELHRLSGAGGDVSDFQRDAVDALVTLSDKSIPESVRVRDFAVTEADSVGDSTLEVALLAWERQPFETEGRGCLAKMKPVVIAARKAHAERERARRAAKKAGTELPKATPARGTKRVTRKQRLAASAPPAASASAAAPSTQQQLQLEPPAIPVATDEPAPVPAPQTEAERRAEIEAYLERMRKRSSLPADDDPDAI